MGKREDIRFCNSRRALHRGQAKIERLSVEAPINPAELRADTNFGASSKRKSGDLSRAAFSLKGATDGHKSLIGRDSEESDDRLRQNLFLLTAVFVHAVEVVQIAFRAQKVDVREAVYFGPSPFASSLGVNRWSRDADHKRWLPSSLRTS